MFWCLTRQQLSGHLGAAAAAFSLCFHPHRVALTTPQPLQLTGGVGGLAGDVVARRSGGDDQVGQSAVARVPGHLACFGVAVHRRLDVSGFTRH